MRAASIYHVLCLLAALFCSRGLGAGYNNASTTGHSQPPAGITSSSFIAAARSSASVREDAYEGCVVKLNQVVSWDWSPIPNFSTNSATVPTNSAGTHTTTVQFVTGAYQRNGSWVPLTGTSTLTFPTGLSYMSPTYYVYSTSGRSSGPTHGVTMSTVFPFPSPLSTLPPWVTGQNKGLTWSLFGRGFNGPGSTEISWLRSVYPHESALQSCSPTTLFFLQQIPPAALQLMSTLPAYSQHASSLQNIWTTLGGASLTTKAAPAQTTATGVAPTGTTTRLQEIPTSFGSRPSRTEGNRPAKVTRVHVATSLNPQHHSEGITNTQLSGSVAEESHSSPSRAAHTSKPIQITIGTDVIEAGSGTEFKIGSKTLFPAGSAVIISSTTYSLAPAATAVVVNGRTSALHHTDQVHAGSASTSPEVHSQVVHGLSMQTKSGTRVLVDGHTLAMDTTMTLGSGSVITRVALATDTAGRTVLLGDLITKAPGTSCVGRCSVIKQSIRSTATDGKLMTSSSAAPSDSSGTSRASSNIRPSKAADTIAMAFFCLLILYFAV